MALVLAAVALVAAVSLLGPGRPRLSALEPRARFGGVRGHGLASGGGPSRESGASRGGGSRPGAGLTAARRTGPSGRRADAAEVDPALAIDLVAAAMLSGVPATTALDVVGAALGGEGGSVLREAAALTSMGADEATAWARASPAWQPLRRALVLAASSGAPSAALLRQAAARVRADRASRRRAAAQRLEVLVLLPMGLCALPAFAALGVVPLVVALAAPLVGR